MNLSGQYKFNQLKEEIHTELDRNTFPSTIFNTVNNIAHVINTIRHTKGINWAQKVLNNGQPVFTPVEQQQYTELLQPYIPSILEFFEESMNDGQKGGAEALKDSLLTRASDKWKDVDLSKFTPDKLFEKVMATFQGINHEMNNAMEVVHYEKKLDGKPDIPLGGTGFMIPPRFIIFLIYYVLDITRVALSVSGNETGRKLLSIIVSILDLVRGDWKKAILTFVGYYGSSPLLIGQALKTYLTVIQMLSPTIQLKIPYFMYDSAKSILFGILLSVIQIGAPKPIRDQLEKMLTTLRGVKNDLDTRLEEQIPRLSQRPDYFNVDFSNLNDLQAVLDDPVYICSKEHGEAINDLLKSAGKNKAMIEMMLDLMRYPHTSGMKQYLCEEKGTKPYVDLLVDEALKRDKIALALVPEKASASAKVPAPASAKVPASASVPVPASAKVPVPPPISRGGTRITKRVLRSSKSPPPVPPPSYE